MAETKKFKTETKRLLDMMINSIYTHKEIFLRELISNASDAIDKYHYISLTNQDIKPRDYQIVIEADKESKTLSIKDNGIGFTHDELVDHLGVIAKSGSKEFMEKLEEANKNEVDIIGQFGVGFYSAFMVASLVEVRTKSPLSDKGYVFKSEGLENYTIDECADIEEGTQIILHLRENTEDNKYDEYLDEYTIKQLVRKYSDYVRYPIKTWVTKYVEAPEKKDDEKEEEEETTELVLETINSMIPLWKKNKSDVTEEDLNEFYKQKFMDFQDPITSMHFNVEGNVTYNSLIFIPKKAPYNLYSDKFEKGLQLYTKGVFILDKCKELVPDYLRFVKGLVDSADLSLNISREMLQEDRGLQKIATNLEKKILSELGKMLKNEREKYVEFFSNYGLNLKYGLYEDYGMKKDSLKDLIILKTVNNDTEVTFKEYIEKMPEGQKYIYYASGKNKEAINKLPQMDLVKKQGYDVFVLTDDVDEFMLQILKEYDSKEFKSINQGDLDLLSKEDADKLEEIVKEKKDLLETLKEALGSEVKDVVISKRLTDSPVCLVSDDGLSFEMEKVLNNSANGQNVKASRILEINPNHKVFKAIENVYAHDKDSIKKYAELLYNQALLIEGIAPSDPVAFANTMCDLIVEAASDIDTTVVNPEIV